MRPKVIYRLFRTCGLLLPLRLRLLVNLVPRTSGTVMTDLLTQTAAILTTRSFGLLLHFSASLEIVTRWVAEAINVEIKLAAEEEPRRTINTLYCNIVKSLV